MPSDHVLVELDLGITLKWDTNVSYQSVTSHVVPDHSSGQTISFGTKNYVWCTLFIIEVFQKFLVLS